MKRFVAFLIVTLLTLGWVGTAENIELLGHRSASDPLKVYVGPTRDEGLYTFVQERGETVWAGMETFRRPAKGVAVAEGYGALPGRIWFKNALIEENGVLVVPEVVAEKIILQHPDRSRFGGITWDRDELGTYFTIHEGAVILYVNGREVERWQ